MRGNFIPPHFSMGMPNPNPNGGGAMNGSYNNNGNPNPNNNNNNNNNMAPHTMGSQAPWIMPPMGMPMNAQFLQTLIGNHPTSPLGPSMMLPSGHPNQPTWFGAGGPPPAPNQVPGVGSGFCAPTMTGQGNQTMPMMFFGAQSSSSLPMVGPGGGGGDTTSLSSSPPASSSAMRSSPPLHPRPSPPPPPSSTSLLNSAAPILSSSDHSHASSINTTTKPEDTSTSSAPLTLSEEVLYSLYCQYGVDLIRTGGMLVGVSPTVIYHASMLFHRFQHAVQTRYRSQYKTADTRTDLNTTLQRDTADASLSLGGNKEHTASPLHQKIEYVIPAHTLSPMSSGMFPLADLCAPLDYCVYHMLSSSDDIVFLAAACLFLSSKLIYNVAPLSVIVKVFLQLSFSRINMSGDYVISLCESRFHDYRKCILQAEVEVCQVLGFRAGYTECPYKYLLCYLEFLVDDNNNGVKDASSVSMASSSSGSHSYWSHSAPYLSWLKEATAVLNDLPRMPSVVLRYGPSALAVYAISDTVPVRLGEDDQEALPVGWSNAFGVSPSLLKEISDAVARERSLFRPTKEVTHLITQLRKPAYLDAKEKAKQDKAAAEAMNTSTEQQQQESGHDKMENTERTDQSPSEADGASLDAVLGRSISPSPSTCASASSSLLSTTTITAAAALATDLRAPKGISGPLSQDSQLLDEVAARIERPTASAHHHNELPPSSTHPIPPMGVGSAAASHCGEQPAYVTNSVPPIIVPPSPDGEHGTLHRIAVTTPDVVTGKVMGLPDTSGKKEEQVTKVSEEAQGNKKKKNEQEEEEEEEDDILIRMRKRKERAQKSSSSSSKVKTSGSSSSATAVAEGEASAGNKTKNASGGSTSRSHHHGSGNEHSSSGSGSNSHHIRYGGRRRSRSRSDSEESRRRLRHEDYSSRSRDRERDREDRSSHRSRHESATNNTSTANGKHVDRRERERDRDANRSDGKYSSRRYDRKRL